MFHNSLSRISNALSVDLGQRLQNKFGVALYPRVPRWQVFLMHLSQVDFELFSSIKFILAVRTDLVGVWPIYLRAHYAPRRIQVELLPRIFNVLLVVLPPLLDLNAQRLPSYLCELVNLIHARVYSRRSMISKLIGIILRKRALS